VMGRPDPPPMPAPERRVGDDTIRQIVGLCQRGATRRWAREVTVRALQERAARTGELVAADLHVGQVPVPVLLLSPRGIFVFDASPRYVRSAQWITLAEAARAISEALPGYPAEIRTAVAIADQVHPPEEFFHANGRLSGVQVGSRSLDQFIELFDDPGPAAGDLQAIREALAGPAPL